MARATPLCIVYYKLDFEVAILCHQIYQSMWTPELNMKLDEIVEQDENKIVVYL